MAEDSPTLDELRQRIADIESGKLPGASQSSTQDQDLWSCPSCPTPTQDATASEAQGDELVTRAPKLIECDICHRLNERTALTDMWKANYGAERPEPLIICPAGGCWGEANKRGYFSPQQSENFTK